MEDQGIENERAVSNPQLLINLKEFVVLAKSEVCRKFRKLT